MRSWPDEAESFRTARRSHAQTVESALAAWLLVTLAPPLAMSRTANDYVVPQPIDGLTAAVHDDVPLL